MNAQTALAVPGAWINYPTYGLQVTEISGQQRAASQAETMLATKAWLVYEELTRNFRIRDPLPTFKTNGAGSGNCLVPFLPAGTKSFIDFRASPQNGDLVIVQWDARTSEMLKRHGSSEVGTGYAQKLYVHIDGREMLLNRMQVHVLGDSRIIGVIRYLEKDGEPLYGSLKAYGPLTDMTFHFVGMPR